MTVGPENVSERTGKHLFTAIGMLGQLCMLYDRGNLSAAPLMTTLLHQLVIRSPNNTPLFDQVGWDRGSFPMAVRSGTLSDGSAQYAATAHLIFGVTHALAPSSQWYCDFVVPFVEPSFELTTVKAWLEAPVAPGASRLLSRFDVIKTIRNKDGGAHADTDTNMEREVDYLELLGWLPCSPTSTIEIEGVAFSASAHLPPVTYPLIRQCAFELLSAIYSFTDVHEHLAPTSIVGVFQGSRLQYVVAPEGYPSFERVYGQEPLAGDPQENPEPHRV